MIVIIINNNYMINRIDYINIKSQNVYETLSMNLE